MFLWLPGSKVNGKIEGDAFMDIMNVLAGSFFGDNWAYFVLGLGLLGVIVLYSMIRREQ